MLNWFIAGTRSKKRGLDETGACANYVETEQVCTGKHSSGSFWFSSGISRKLPFECLYIEKSEILLSGMATSGKHSPRSHTAREQRGSESMGLQYGQSHKWPHKKITKMRTWGVTSLEWSVAKRFSKNGKTFCHLWFKPGSRCSNKTLVLIWTNKYK